MQDFQRKDDRISTDTQQVNQFNNRKTTPGQPHREGEPHTHTQFGPVETGSGNFQCRELTAYELGGQGTDANA